jgi:flavin-binding protein dodecin
MVKKGIELIGTSTKSFEEAVENAIKEAATTIRGTQWVEVMEFTCKVTEGKVEEYQARVKIFFKVER